MDEDRFGAHGLERDGRGLGEETVIRQGEGVGKDEYKGSRIEMSPFTSPQRWTREACWQSRNQRQLEIGFSWTFTVHRTRESGLAFGKRVW